MSNELVQTASDLRVQLRHHILEVQQLKDAFANMGEAELYGACDLTEKYLKGSVEEMKKITASEVLQ